MINESERGREAESPKQMTRLGWRDILWRTQVEMSKDNVTLIAAGVAFYAFFSIFPILIALISVWALLVDPAQIQTQIQSVASILPSGARMLLASQVQRIAETSGSGALTFTFVGSVLLALWSGSKGVKSLFTAMNIAYDEKENRGFFKLNFMAVGMTFGGVVLSIVTLSLIAVLPALIGSLGLPEVIQTWSQILRWPLLLLTAFLGLGFIYHYGPSRTHPKWRWVSWGAVVATMLWLAVSGLFSWYVSNFGKYNETYGSLGAVVILLMWFYLTALVTILGAELNSEMEHQTTRDTTRGEPKQIGKRGAHVADTVGEKRVS